MQKLTTIILAIDNKIKIEECLKSIEALDGNLIILTTIKEYVEKYNAIEITRSLDIVLNELISNAETDWFLFLNSHEVVDNCAKIAWVLINENSNKSFNLMIKKNNLITKELRLWDKNLQLKFENNMFPSLSCSKIDFLDCCIKSNYQEEYNEILIKEWLNKNPTSSKPYYYYAFCNLSKKKL